MFACSLVWIGGIGKEFWNVIISIHTDADHYGRLGIPRGCPFDLV